MRARDTGGNRFLLLDTSAYFPSSPFFVDPAAELGLTSQFFDEAPYGCASQLSSRIFRRVFRSRLNRRFEDKLLAQAIGFRPDVVLITKGSLLRRATLDALKERTRAVFVNFATDDPFNKASGSADLINCIPAYDMYLSTKRQIMPDLVRAGARRPIFLPFAHKPEVHFPDTPVSPAEARRFSCDIAFAGAADPDRVPYFEALARIPMLNLRLYGSFWRKQAGLRKFARGTVYGRDYRLALCGAKICVGLVRRANRDGHAMRSFEIPACGTFLLAEKTDEHQEMFVEDKEAAFFSSIEELLDKVHFYLKHDAIRDSIRNAGYRRITGGRNTYTDRLNTLISYL